MKNSGDEWEKLIQSLVQQGILRSERIIRAMKRVRREWFVPDNMKNYATVDTPLPLGFGQTASAPHG